jgi:hypothetical protein
VHPPALMLPTARSYAGVHTVHAVCPQCDRFVELDLAALVEAGQGDIPLIHLPLRCSACGKTGHQIKVSGRSYGLADR